jgi:hypothetical protein
MYDEENDLYDEALKNLDAIFRMAVDVKSTLESLDDCCEDHKVLRDAMLKIIDDFDIKNHSTEIRKVFDLLCKKDLPGEYLH